MTEAIIKPEAGAVVKHGEKVKDQIGKVIGKIAGCGSELQTIWDSSFEYTDKNEMIGMMVNAAWTAYWQAFRNMMEMDGKQAERVREHEAKIEKAKTEIEAAGDEGKDHATQVWATAVKDFDKEKNRMMREKEGVFTAWERSGRVAQSLAHEYRQSKTNSGYYIKTSEIMRFMEVVQLTLQSRLSGKLDLLHSIQKELNQRQRELFPITINQEEAEI